MDNTSPNLLLYPVTVDEWTEHHKKLQECDDALFGGWDSRLRKRTSGVLEQLNFINLMMKVLGVIGVVSFLKDLGVPTQVVLPFLLKLISSTSGG